MKKLLWLLICLILIILISAFLHHMSSYVLFQFGQKSVAVPLWLALDLLLIVLAVIYYTVKIVRYVWRIPRRLRGQYQKHKQHKQMNLAKQAFSQWLTEQDDEAAASFIQLAQQDWYATQCLLIAVKLSKRIKTKHHLIAQITTEQPADQLALLLVRFDIAVQMANHSAAKRVLTTALAQFPHNPVILRRAIQLYQITQDFSNLLDTINKLHAIDHTTANIDAITISAYQGLLKAAAATEIDVLWRTILSKYKKSPALITVYAQQLFKWKQTEKAYTLLRKALDKNADAALFVLFCYMHHTDPGQQLQVAEKVLPLLPISRETYCAMAWLCQRNQLTDKVKYYLEKTAVSLHD